MSKNGIADRVSHLGDRARERMTHARLEKLDRDNERLRGEVAMLREDLQEERDALKEAVKALGDDRPSVRTGRRPHVVRTIVVAGTAYVLGTRAGRERYEQIVRRFREMRDAMRGAREERNDAWSGPEMATDRSSNEEGQRGTVHGI
jgi:hypothetical protein